ncbi:hypothetical protein BKN38_08775 [Helicobacter sp. CLO-3]|uniref:hypothetical protein n=1 Tax=unclassified Helicobacter TaxID=2593540 RepID=UPI0008053FBB|nr:MULTISPECIES: hypothetical protein [unclassified Helicobacter]OBV28939.1 hypothetical protein BA723_07370 [Helicobacter sp. CLO-3]OHU81555.1 hypothetical protein BKN38_08775 [Helicobacter sp. CLO-3]
MKKSMITLSLALSVALADTATTATTAAQESQEAKAAPIATAQAEPSTSALEKIASSKFVQALAGSKVSGFAFGRYRVAGGRDAKGDTYQWRAIANIESGRYHGWALGSGIIFTTGAIAADAKSSEFSGGVFGSRAGRLNTSNDAFGINSVYISKEMGSSDKTYFKGDIGMLRMDSIFMDSNLDRGIGLVLKLKSGGLTYALSGYDQWITDALVLNFAGRGLGIQSTSAGTEIGNNLFIFEVKGDAAKFGGVGFDIAYAYADKLFNYDVFAQASYGVAGFSAKAQVAAAGLADDAHIIANGNTLPAAGTNGAQRTNLRNFFANQGQYMAKHRGVYNIVLAYKGEVGEKHGFSGKLGYLGSWGQGYGVGFKANAGLDFAGKSWFNGLTTTKEGFGLFGSGATKGSSISVAYLGLTYEYEKKYGVGLDIAYVGGNNYMPILSRSSLTSAAGTGMTSVRSQDLLEITPSISYKPLEHLSLSAFYSIFALDAQWQYVGFEGNYKF